MSGGELAGFETVECVSRLVFEAWCELWGHTNFDPWIGCGCIVDQDRDAGTCAWLNMGMWERKVGD